MMGLMRLCLILNYEEGTDRSKHQAAPRQIRKSFIDKIVAAINWQTIWR
jgi:hypothetical protein